MRISLIEEGARVAVCGRDPHRLTATEQRLRDAGGDALVVQADVTRLADLEWFVDAAVARWVSCPAFSGLANLRLSYAVALNFRYSSMTSCGVRYPSAE